MESQFQKKWRQGYCKRPDSLSAVMKRSEPTVDSDSFRSTILVLCKEPFDTAPPHSSKHTVSVSGLAGGERGWKWSGEGSGLHRADMRKYRTAFVCEPQVGVRVFSGVVFVYVPGIFPDQFRVLVRIN